MTGNRDVRFDFTGQVVLVTGGASGIGLQIAKDFAGAGAHVVIAGRSEQRLASAVADIGHGAAAVRTDVGDRDQVRSLVDGIVSEHGRLDIVVSNAASYIPGDITEIDPADWEQLRRTNIDGFFHLAQAALPHLAASRGNLVATSSVSGLRGDWGQSIYNASKGAVSLFVQSLALDWGARGVPRQCRRSSMTDTEPVAAVTGDAALLGQFEARVALGRIADTADISPAVLFLASDAARYITGVILPVDGGTSASTGQAHVASA